MTNSPAMAKTHAALKEQAHKTALWLVNNQLSCLDLPAERIVENCLRALLELKPEEEFGANPLIDGVAFVYLHSSRNEKEFRRRFRKIMEISTTQQERK